MTSLIRAKRLIPMLQVALHQGFHGRPASTGLLPGRETQRLHRLAALVTEHLQVNALARVLPEDTQPRSTFSATGYSQLLQASVMSKSTACLVPFPSPMALKKLIVESSSPSA